MATPDDLNLAPQTELAILEATGVIATYLASEQGQPAVIPRRSDAETPVF